MPAIFLSFFLLFGSFSCSHLSNNLVREGEVKLIGGRRGERVWKDSLSFKRHSWYRGMTLMFDLLHTKITPETPFYDWLSEGEKQGLSRCVDHHIILSYEYDREVISRSTLMEAAGKSGYRRLALEGLFRHLKMRPELRSLSLFLYKAYGLCREKGVPGPIRINFPGFGPVLIP